MRVFDGEWINYIHCILWRLKSIDEWVFHRVIYELSREDVIPVNGWKWFNEWPRSNEIDALIGFLKLIGVVDVEDSVIKAVKPPVVECSRLNIDFEKITMIAERFKQLSSVSRTHG